MRFDTEEDSFGPKKVWGLLKDNVWVAGSTKVNSCGLALPETPLAPGLLATLFPSCPFYDVSGASVDNRC